MGFPCPRSRLRIWSRKTGLAVPSLVSLLILHTQVEPSAYSRDSLRFPRRRPFIYLNRQSPSGQSRVYQITQLRTDGVHCRESAGTRPAVLRVLPFQVSNCRKIALASLEGVLSTLSTPPPPPPRKQGSWYSTGGTVSGYIPLVSMTLPLLHYTTIPKYGMGPNVSVESVDP